MAESSRFWATNNTGDGINTGFTVTHWQNLLLKLFEGGEEANGAVLRGVGSALLPTGVASPITVPTGAAIGYGYFYENDANVTHVVSTPVVGTTGGHIVLETNWAAQTVRTKVYKNTDGINTPPALTQTAGTLWQTRLCTFTITTGGVIAITDARNMAHYSTEIITAMIADLAITSAKIAANAVITSKILDANVTAAKLAAGAALSNLGFTPWYSGNDGAGSGLDADLLDGQDSAFFLAFANFTGSLAYAQVPNDLIDDVKVGNRVPQAIRRLGGNATDWNVGGSTAYTPGMVRMQFGCFDLPTINAGANSGTFHTLPVAFGAVGLVFCSTTDPKCIATGVMRADKVTIDFSTNNVGSVTSTGGKVYWFAVGTE